MKQLFFILIVLTLAGTQSCTKDNYDYENDEFLVTFMDQASKCHGLLIRVEAKDKERLRHVINGGEETQYNEGSVVIGVFMLQGEYKAGQKLILKLRKPDSDYTGICTAEVLWYKTAFVADERVYK